MVGKEESGAGEQAGSGYRLPAVSWAFEEEGEPEAEQAAPSGRTRSGGARRARGRRAAGRRARA